MRYDIEIFIGGRIIFLGDIHGIIAIMIIAAALINTSNTTMTNMLAANGSLMLMSRHAMHAQTTHSS